MSRSPGLSPEALGTAPSPSLPAPRLRDGLWAGFHGFLVSQGETRSPGATQLGVKGDAPSSRLRGRHSVTSVDEISSLSDANALLPGTVTLFGKRDH